MDWNPLATFGGALMGAGMPVLVQSRRHRREMSEARKKAEAAKEREKEARLVTVENACIRIAGQLTEMEKLFSERYKG